MNKWFARGGSSRGGVSAGRGIGVRRVGVMLMGMTAVLLLGTTAAMGGPTLDQVGKSFQQNVTHRAETSKLIAVAAGAVALLILVGVVNARSRRAATPRPLHNQGKLLKEILKQVPLKAPEIKRLKALADEKECSSPLVPLLCPSMMKRGDGRTGPARR